MLLLCTLMAQAASAAALYDFGTADSAVREGFTRVAAESVYSDDAGFGWESTDGLEAQHRVYRDPVENTSRGTMDPPPIYTNEVTEDCIHSGRPATFLTDVEPGAYTVWVVYGTSEPERYQFYDFTVSVGDAEERVQIEGGQRFVWVRLEATVEQGPLAIRIAPSNRWTVNAVLVLESPASPAWEASVQPLKHEMETAPPDEWEQWQEEPHVDSRPWFPMHEEDVRRGYLVLRQHYLEPMFRDTTPLAHTRNPELRAFATLGEYEPLTFTVRPLARDLSGVTVTVSDLTQGDAVIPASETDVRHVPYVRCRPNYTVRYGYLWNPDYLARFTSLDLPADENRRFWLTVHVPDAAEPGTYQGTVTFDAEDAESADIPILFRVLPIRLQQDPTKIYGIYYRSPLDKAANAPDEVSRAYFERKAELEARDMVAHGTRNVVMGVWSPAADEDGNFSFNYDLLAAKIDLALEYDFTPPFVMSFNVSGIYGKYMEGGLGSHLRTVAMPPPEFFAEVAAAVTEIERERTARGWPEFLYYPIDEPGRSAEAVGFMVGVLKAIKAVPGARTYVTADPTAEAFQPMKPFVDVWCTQPFDPDRETVLADSAARGVEYWCYPNHVNGENDHTPVTGARMTYGFGFWRSGFRTLIPWIYQYSVGDPLNYLDGRMSDFFNRHEPDGTPIPVAMWEAYREGWDDYRYVYTLTQLIDQARADGRTKLADAAQADLDYIWTAIEVQTKYKHDNLWGPEEFDAYRWLIATHILRLAP